MTKFGANPRAAVELYTDIRMAVRIYGAKPVAYATGITRSLIGKICGGSSVRTKVPHDIIRQGLQRLMFDRLDRARNDRVRMTLWERTIEKEGGIRAAARKLGLDPSNMSKVMARHKRRSEGGEFD